MGSGIGGGSSAVVFAATGRGTKKKMGRGSSWYGFTLRETITERISNKRSGYVPDAVGFGRFSCVGHTNALDRRHIFYGAGLASASPDRRENCINALIIIFVVYFRL